ncbi:MAG: glycerophosphodiester phosphodiesterase, partial [Proteobacteria bacterium]
MIKPLLFLLIPLLSCGYGGNIPLPKVMDQTTGFDRQGHRGCRGLMPENTIAAMKRALGLGVTTLEMDVVITRDKKVVLSHDPYFNHEI